MKITFDVVRAESSINNIMRYSGVFDQGKSLGQMCQISMMVSSESAAKYDAIAEQLKEALEAAGSVVSFVSLRDVDGVECRSVMYFSSDINVLSNGSFWYRFCDYLRGFGYDPEVDDRFFVKGFKS